MTTAVYECDDKITDQLQAPVAAFRKPIKEKIFKSFFSTKPIGQRTGLDLSLSYDIIKAHRGNIQVHSKDGEGTEFNIFLSLNEPLKT